MDITIGLSDQLITSLTGISVQVCHSKIASLCIFVDFRARMMLQSSKHFSDWCNP